MVTAFEKFSFWYAKSLTDNTSDKADNFLHITNADQISLRYVRPSTFAKRVTDVSNIQSQDKKAPDTGNAINGVELQFAYDRTTAASITPLKKLINMWFRRGTDDNFRDARFGLTSTDSPELNANPSANAGYRLMNFEQLPNSDTPGVLLYLVQLQFLGDHTKLNGWQTS